MKKPTVAICYDFDGTLSPKNLQEFGFFHGLEEKEGKSFWTQSNGKAVETLMGKHRFCPLNPDIANTFFRAGYIESWGRGVEKICRICHNYGIPDPEYTVHPNDIMLCFKTNIGQRGGDQSGDQSIPVRILAALRQNPKCSLRSVALALGVSVKTVKQYVAKLQQAGSLRRIGGTRGYWEVVHG